MRPIDGTLVPRLIAGNLTIIRYRYEQIGVEGAPGQAGVREGSLSLKSAFEGGVASPNFGMYPYRQITTAAGSAMTIDNLREFWLAQIEVFDEMTNLLEAERGKGRLGKPQRTWLIVMNSWRGELVRLLAEYPGTRHA